MKMIKSMVLTSVILVSAQADFLMKLTDKNGVEESLCVKSYSYSNNLESLHKQQAQTIDEYSIQETLTNKRWMGKPVYRRVFKDLTGFIGDGKWRLLPFNNESDNIEESINAEMKVRGSHEYYTIYGSSTSQFRYYIAPHGIMYIATSNFVPSGMNATVILEYTKTTDSIQNPQSQLVSYVHYVPSNSTSNELLSKSLEDKSVGFFKNYTYDSSTDSCIAPSN